MVELNTKVNTDYVVSSCWRLTRYLFLEKVLRKVLISFPIETWTQPLLIVAVDVWCHTVQSTRRSGNSWRRLATTLTTDTQPTSNAWQVALHCITPKCSSAPPESKHSPWSNSSFGALLHALPIDLRPKLGYELKLRELPKLSCLIERNFLIKQLYKQCYHSLSLTFPTISFYYSINMQ